MILKNSNLKIAFIIFSRKTTINRIFFIVLYNDYKTFDR